MKATMAETLRGVRHWLGATVLAGSCLQSARGDVVSEATIQLSNAQYVRASEAYYRDGATSSATSWKLGWKAKAQRRGWFAVTDLRNDYQAEEDHHYFKPFALAAGWQGERNKVTLGRERYEWSTLDEHWRIGLWQPRFTDDLLARETAGFTGAFWRVGGQEGHILLYSSPIYVPDIGPDFSLKNSRFVSKNPWFRPPTDLVNLDGIPTDVRYRLNKPSVSDVVNHAMAAAQIQFQPSPESFVRLSAAYKPVNQLLIGFPLKLWLTDPKYAEVDVQTRIVYHQVATFEAGLMEANGWTVWGSLSSDRPVRDDPPPEWTTQEIDDAVIGGLFVAKNLRGSGANASAVHFSYLRVEGGDARDQGEFVGTKSFFERRYMFQDAVQVGARHTVPWLTSKWLTRFAGSVTYEFAQHGILMSGHISQALSKYWTAQLSADFVGLVDRSGRVQDGFMSSFRANDRVGLGVQYVF